MSNLPGLQFPLGEEIEMLRDSLAGFAAKEIAPRAAEIDRTDQIRWTCGRSSATWVCSA